ncbi:MAG: GTPase ObgE [Anaerolineae bacterium]|nr:GTPase ObgE [Anaerolineae bacterium]MDW8070605.1 GTPase ObgE [Anaerolineae bacterium]
METFGFIDEAKIYVRGGDGGNGIVAFRREKYVPRGGPAGGDGGDGGDVILEADAQMNTLFPLHQQTHFAAGRGAHGRGKNQTGARGHDVVIRVPVGTVVYDAESGALLADLATPGQRIVVARGGRGGRGNARFATSVHQAPRIAEKGEPGERRWLRLELKLLADVGLIGMPNAGKSTLLSVVSAAKPKIADYPFTTLQPNLGVVSVDGEYEFVLADLPGLIEGAHAGAGLGHQFLRHVERTRLLIHVLDGSQPEVFDHYIKINEELRLYNPLLVERPQVIAFNKMDLPEAQARWPVVEKRLSRERRVFPISAATGQGVWQLMRYVGQLLQTLPPAPMPTAVPVFRLDETPGFTVRREGEIWLVEGKRIEQLVARTMWQYADAAERAQRQMEAMGVLEALRRAGVQPGDTVRIGNIDLEWLW